MMDSLRYWVLEMHVDGFRFDLAASLARQFHEVDRLSAFFDIIQQDPVRQVKLIAEPWDVGDGGYQVGNFPPCGRNGTASTAIPFAITGAERRSDRDLAERLTGSSDLYEATGRRPCASINFVTCHDGFTLADLVSYSDKHNEANGEGGRDGMTTIGLGTAVLKARPTIRRPDLAPPAGAELPRHPLPRQGVPMLLGGDELGRTQAGNNNAYCQDSPISWYDWGAVDREVLSWTQRLIALRRSHPVFRRRRFFQGHPLRGTAPDDQLPDVGWFRNDGQTMTDADWEVGYAKSLGVFLNGLAIREPDVHGRPIVDDSFYLLFNGWDQEVDFILPPARLGLVLGRGADSAAGIEGEAGAPQPRRPAGGGGPGSGTPSTGVAVGSAAGRPGLTLPGSTLLVHLIGAHYYHPCREVPSV